MSSSSKVVVRFSTCIVAVLVWTADPSRVFATPARVPEQRFWVPDGGVNAIAATSDVVYLGGGFTRVGSLPDGQIAFQIDAQPGLSVIVQWSSNLVNWLDLQTTDATGASFDFVDSTATNLVR